MGFAQPLIPVEVEHILIVGNFKLLAGDEYAITFERLNQSRNDFVLRLDVRQALKLFGEVPCFWIAHRPLVLALWVGVAGGNLDTPPPCLVNRQEALGPDVSAPARQQVHHKHIVAEGKREKDLALVPASNISEQKVHDTSSKSVVWVSNYFYSKKITSARKDRKSTRLNSSHSSISY